MEVMFPGGWNSQIETNNTEHYPDPVQSALEKKEKIPGGWISQRNAANTQEHPGLVKDNMEEKEMIPGGWNRHREGSGSVEGPPPSPNHTGIPSCSGQFFSWKGLGISLLAIIFGGIALQLYFNLLCFSVSETALSLVSSVVGSNRDRQGQTGRDRDK